jgi:hypothetical protein
MKHECNKWRRQNILHAMLSECGLQRLGLTLTASLSRSRNLPPDLPFLSEVHGCLSGQTHIGSVTDEQGNNGQPGKGSGDQDSACFHSKGGARGRTLPCHPGRRAFQAGAQEINSEPCFVCVQSSANTWPGGWNQCAFLISSMCT